MLLKELFEKHGVGVKFMAKGCPVHTIIGVWEEGVICTSQGTPFDQLYVTFNSRIDDYEVVL